MAAFTYDLLEDKCVEQLQSVIQSAALVAAMPENESEFKKVQAKPIIYVAYEESEFQQSASTGPVKQFEDAVISCNIRAGKRRGTGGIFEMLKKVKESLQGFKIPGLGEKKLELKSIKLIARDSEERFWEYNISFSFQKVQAQVLEDEGEVLTDNYQGSTFQSNYETEV